MQDIEKQGDIQGIMIILWKCKVCMEGKGGWDREGKLKLVVYKDMKFSEVDYNCFYGQVS